MKKIITLILLAGLFACECPQEKPQMQSPKNYEAKSYEASSRDAIEMITIDKHEYIIVSYKGYKAGGMGICHKEDCKFCKNKLQ